MKMFIPSEVPNEVKCFPFSAFSWCWVSISPENSQCYLLCLSVQPPYCRGEANKTSTLDRQLQSVTQLLHPRRTLADTVSLHPGLHEASPKHWRSLAGWGVVLT